MSNEAGIEEDLQSNPAREQRPWREKQRKEIIAKILGPQHNRPTTVAVWRENQRKEIIATILGPQEKRSQEEGVVEDCKPRGSNRFREAAGTEDWRRLAISNRCELAIMRYHHSNQCQCGKGG